MIQYDVNNIICSYDNLNCKVIQHNTYNMSYTCLLLLLPISVLRFWNSEGLTQA